MCFKILLNTLKNANEFVEVCGHYEEDVNYLHGRFIVDAKSIMGVLSCDISEVAVVEIITDDANTIKKFKKSIEKWIVKE